MGLLSLLTICLLILLKFAIDAVLIHKSHSFLTTTKMQYLILSSLFYPFFSVSVALYSLIGKYEWKVDAFRSLITVVEENPTSIAQIELISSQSVSERDKSESWKNSKTTLL
jgi:hypothetical protein